MPSAGGDYPRERGPEPRLSVNLRDTYKVAQLVGPGSINDTDTRWDVYGADLGHMFLANGRMLVTFGDTFGGPPAFPFFSVSHTGHRGNTMGWVDPAATRPAEGLELAGMITGTTGAAQDHITYDVGNCATPRICPWQSKCRLLESR